MLNRSLSQMTRQHQQDMHTPEYSAMKYVDDR